MRQDDLLKIKASLKDLQEPDQQTQANLQDNIQNQRDYLQEKIRQEQTSTRRLMEEVNAMADERKARKGFSWAILIAVIIYMAAVLFIFIQHKSYGISDAVMVALLGTTTVTVLGLLVAVVRYLFPGHR